MLLVDEEWEFVEKLYYQGDLEVVKKLILFYLCFVVYIVCNYLGYGLLQVDLIQEGNIGLMKVVCCFNLEVGVCLVFFVVYWIKVEIYEYVLCNWCIVKVVIIKVQCKLFFNLCKIKQCLGWFNQDEVEMVVCELGVLSKDVCEMEFCMVVQDMIFDMLFDDEFDSQLMVLVLYLQDKMFNFVDGIEDDNWEEQVVNKLIDVMQGLDECSQDIICVCWLDEDNKFMLQELVDCYGVFVECVCQLEKNVMKKLCVVIEV